jgi:hypothetical protein
MKVALLVHRWFVHGGAGWAYHPGLQPSLMACRMALKDELHGELGSVGPLEVPGAGLVLVGVRTADPDRATDDYGRPLAVLRAAALPGRPDEAGQEELCRLLHDRSVPDHPGADPALGFDWSGSVTPLPPPAARPRAPVPGRRRGLVWLGLAAACVVILAAAALSRLPRSGDTPSLPQPPVASTARGDTAPTARPGPSLADREKQVTQLLTDIGRAGDTAALKDLLQTNDLGSLSPDTLAGISEAVRNRGKQLLDGLRAETCTGEDPDEVNHSVGQAAALLELARQAPDRLQAGMEVRPHGDGAKAEKQNWELFQQKACLAIDRLRYSRVQVCHRALAEQIKGDSKEWTGGLQALQQSLDDYAKPKRKTSPRFQDNVDRLLAWCTQIRTMTTYDFLLFNLPEDWYLLADPEKGRQVLHGDSRGTVRFSAKLKAYESDTPTVPLEVELRRHDDRAYRRPLAWRLDQERVSLKVDQHLPAIMIVCPQGSPPFGLPACAPVERPAEQEGASAVTPDVGSRSAEPGERSRAGVPARSTARY